MKKTIGRKGAVLPVISFVLCLIFSGTGFTDDSNKDFFNEFINSPENDSEDTTNKDISPNEVMNAEAPEKSHHEDRAEESEKTDTMRSLQMIPAEDKTCVKDIDCTAGVIDCVSWAAYNKNYTKRLLKGSASCPDSIDPGFQPATVCVAKRCQTTDKTTEASWDDWLHEGK